MRQLNQLPDAPPLGSNLIGAQCHGVSGSDKGGKILGVIAFFRSEGNGQ